MVLDVVMNILGSDAFAALMLTAVATAATAIIGWVGHAIRRHVLRQLSERELAMLRQVAVVAVDYAEQVFGDQGGEAKLASAMEAANKMLQSYGIKVSAEQLRAAIEAAVFAEIARWEKEFATPEAAGVSG